MRTATRTAAFPVHYAPPYAASHADLPYQPYGAAAPAYMPQPAYGAQPRGFAPPPGPPPMGAAASNDALPGYGYGAGAKHAEDEKKDDPFADFEEVPRSGAGAERDVTSRPAPGGRSRFEV